jgi:hypothetical protein
MCAMGMSNEEKTDLKKNLAAARQKALNFGLCIAAKPEETAMLIHRTKAPEVLQKFAKKIGKSPKLACGTVECKGKLVMLTCLEEPPKGTAKKLKLFFKSATGDSMKVQLLDASGGVLEGDDDEETTAAQPAPVEPQEDTGADDELSAKLNAVLQKLAPKIKAALTQTPRAKEAILKLVAAIKAAGAAGDGATAKKRLSQLSEVLTRLAAAASAAPQGLSLVKLGKARIEWPDTHTKAFDDLKRLKTRIEADYADMPEAASEVAGAISLLDKSFSTFNDKLHDQLDAVLNADETDRQSQIDAARAMINAFTKHVDSDPIISALDDNDILPDISIAAPIRAKLQEISTALGR